VSRAAGAVARDEVLQLGEEHGESIGRRSLVINDQDQIHRAGVDY
jgi:hypothetical protein